MIRQAIAGSNKNHITYKINTGTFLRYRMFYLKSGIHFKKIEVLVFIHHKLQSPGTVISYFPASLYSHLQHPFSRLFLHKRRRRLFYYLLISSLDGAFTFIQMNYIPIFITQYLHFDMMGIFDILLYINRIVPK